MWPSRKLIRRKALFTVPLRSDAKVDNYSTIIHKSNANGRRDISTKMNETFLQTKLLLMRNFAKHHWSIAIIVHGTLQDFVQNFHSWSFVCAY